MPKSSWHIRTLPEPGFSAAIALVTLARTVHTGRMEERLQKILSAQGICSRRKAEEYIRRGLVKVNGCIAEVGQKADLDRDHIEVDGAVVRERKEMLYYVMHKPTGVITSNLQRDAGDVPTVLDLLPKHLRGKVFPVGRLDKETSGLLLFTNDGVLAYRLTHPKFDHEKEYEVVTAHPITDGQLRKLAQGMTIDGEKTKRAGVHRLDPSKFRIILTEGKNRQIRRMCQKVGAPVKDLRRIRITTLRDPVLREGGVRELSEAERRNVLRSVGLGE